MEEKKSDFQEKMKSLLDELESKLDSLKVKAKDASVDAKAKYNDAIKDLEPKIVEGKAKLKELADSADDAWDEVKVGAHSIWEQMKTTFKNVKDKFDNDDEVQESTDETPADHQPTSEE